MNRTGNVPQALRGLPNGFGAGQQQPQQSGRAGASRITNGKLVNSGSGWAFGGVGPMSGGLQNPTRQLGGNVSFAQSLSGSTPATPFDLSEFPQLSNNPQHPNASQQSMWGGQVSRNLGAPVQGNQPASMPQQTPQDDLYSPASRISSGAERNNLMTSLGLASQGAGAFASSSTAATRSGNGLLNAVTANTRTTEARSPVGARPTEGQSSLPENGGRQKPPTAFREDNFASQASAPDGPAASSSADARNPLGAIGNDAPAGKAPEAQAASEAPSRPAPQDPLAGMSQADKYGLKGLTTLMNNYPDYNALILGIDPASLGLDQSSDKPYHGQHYSLFDSAPPRPAIPKFTLPECYKVNNVQPIEQKVPSLADETLMFMFYSCPMDVKQRLAAVELYGRNWRWHKKLQIWLTKDDVIQPVPMGQEAERGYYIIWDTVNWRKERRELVLQYSDLEGHPAPMLSGQAA